MASNDETKKPNQPRQADSNGLESMGMDELLDLYSKPSLVEGEIIKEARFALGGVAHKPWRDQAAEAVLCGQAASADNFNRAADLLLRDAKGFAHNAFKIELARRAIVRALTQAARGTPQSQSNKKVR